MPVVGGARFTVYRSKDFQSQLPELIKTIDSASLNSTIGLVIFGDNIAISLKTAVGLDARSTHEAAKTISILYDGWKHFERPDFAVYKGASGEEFEKSRPKKANEDEARNFSVFFT